MGVFAGVPRPSALEGLSDDESAEEDDGSKRLRRIRGAAMPLKPAGSCRHGAAPPTSSERFWLGQAPGTAHQHGGAAVGAHPVPEAAAKLAPVPGGSREVAPSSKCHKRHLLGRLKAWMGTLCRRNLPKLGPGDPHGKPTLQTPGGSQDEVSGTCASPSPQLTT